MKKTFCLCLMLFLGINTNCFAVESHTYTKVIEENYSASSPVGQFATYGSGNNAQTIHHYQAPFYEENYVATEPLPSSYQNIEVPQHYDKRTTITKSVRDDRERADKVISRAWSITGILSILGLITMGILGSV